MASRFISLATLLRGEAAPPRIDEPPQAAPPPSDARPDDANPDRDEVCAARDVLLFRLRIAEAFECARSALLADIATAVVGRELELAPASIDAIVAALISTYAAEMPVCVRVAKATSALAALGVPLEIDPRLHDGDAILVVRDGALESTLGVRLAAVLAAC